MRIYDYLDPRLITFLNVETRDEAIHKMIDLLDEEKRLFDKTAFQNAIFYRESLVSTGIGMSVAIPHAKLKGFEDFFIAIGVQQSRGIHWNSLDQAPVRLVFMIGGPEDRQTEYLQILSLLTSAIRDVQIRKQILTAPSPDAVLDLFSDL